jgi:hypothetical protein
MGHSGPSVHFDTLPDVVVRGWGPAAERLFVLCIETDSALDALGAPDAVGRVRIPAQCPSQGAVRVVAKGRRRIPENSLPGLVFTLLGLSQE